MALGLGGFERIQVIKCRNKVNVPLQGKSGGFGQELELVTKPISQLFTGLQTCIVFSTLPLLPTIFLSSKLKHASYSIISHRTDSVDPRFLSQNHSQVEYMGIRITTATSIQDTDEFAHA